MLSDPDPEDEDGLGRPPPPEDRLWRHPSELTPVGALGPVTYVSRTHTGPRVWTVGVLSALIGAGATLAVLAGVGTFEDRPTNTVVEQIQRSVPKQPGASDLAIAQAAIPAIARVTATGGGTATGGSAFVFRTDGHMITTADAIDGAETITVTFSDGQTSSAHLVGVDRSTDLAVIKADRTDLTGAVLAQTDDLQLGEPTIAIACTPGHPEAPMISVGLVSAIDRHVSTGDSALYGMIQTNVKLDGTQAAAGAVLVDSSGSVIGVISGRGVDQDTEIPTRFAIPITFAKSIADQLITNGRVSRPWLGVEGTDLSQSERSQLGRGGAKVTIVAEDSPASSAGVQVGDVIVSVDGKPIDSMADLVVNMRTHEPDDVIAIGFVSRGESQVGMTTLVDRSTGY